MAYERGSGKTKRLNKDGAGRKHRELSQTTVIALVKTFDKEDTENYKKMIIFINSLKGELPNE